MRVLRGSVHLFSLRRAVFDLVGEWIGVAIITALASKYKEVSCTHSIVFENRPRSDLMLSIQKDVMFDIKAISYSAFSEMIQAHASIPADIAAWLNASNGSATM